MDNLNEASVWESKYGFGHKVVPKSKALSRFSVSNKKYTIDSVFVKVQPTETKLEILVGVGDFEFYVQSQDTKEIFRVKGSSGIGNVFNHYKGQEEGRQLPSGVSATDFLETFALMSIMGAKSLSDTAKYKSSEMMFDPSIFNDSNDFTKAEIESILRDTTKLSSPKSFIHKNIKQYYNALSEYEKDVKQLKTNTSDVVLIYSNHQPSDVIKALKSNYSYKEDDTGEGMITLVSSGESIQFKQVSLKAGKEGARLGRITSIMKNMTDMNESTDFGLPTITLNEGFRGFLNKAINLGKMSISKFNQVRKSVFEFLSRLVAIFKPSAFKRTLDKETSIYLRKNKDVKAYLDGALNESPERIKLTEGVLNRINKKIDILESVVNTGSDSTKLITLHTKLASNIKTDTSTKFMNLLICNEISLECLTRLIPIIKAKGAPEHVSQMIDVMRRGSTALPVIIAYSDGSPVEILQGIDPVSPRAALESVIVVIHPSSNTHYVINIYYLVELNKNLDDSVFVKVQMTNAGGGAAISWKVEGNTMTTYKKIQESI